MNAERKKEIREEFGKYLENHRKEVLRVPSVRQLSFNSNLDNSKLSKIEKGLINFEFDTLIELALTYKLTKKKVLGFMLEGLDEEE
jgi:transcriptional regulator with XRE-family HTH domain